MSRSRNAVDAHQKRVRRLLSCCRRVQAAYTSGSVHIVDIELVYESSLLSAMGSFEGCLEVLLEEFVCGVKSSRPSVRAPRVKPRSRSDFRSVLLRGRKYVNYAPYSETIKHAKHFLIDGLPFSDFNVVSNSDRNTLAELQIVRNAIAHKTDNALSKFRTQVPAASSLPPHLRRPGRFLRTTFRAYPAQTHMENYCMSLMSVPAEILAAW